VAVLATGTELARPGEPLELGQVYEANTSMLAAAVAAPLAGRVLGPLGGRAGPRTTMLMAMVVQGTGLVLIALALGGGIAGVVVGSVVWASGKVVADVAGTVIATSGLGTERTGLAAGLLTTSQQLGSALGLGVVAAVVAASTGPLVAGLRAGLLTCAAFVAAALAVMLPGPGHLRSRRPR
jgi:MFS family permease